MQLKTRPDPRVRLRVGEMLHERKAIRVVDEGELGRLRQRTSCI